MSGNRLNRNSSARAGAWSKSKYTNLQSYDPWDLEISTVLTKIDKKLENHNGIFYHQIRTHPKFISPLRLRDVKILVGNLPRKFVRDLEAVILLGGTNKQEKSSNTLTYGCCFSNKIFIHAFPTKCLETIYKSIPKPSIMNEYRRAGAKIEEHNNGLKVRFDRNALKVFYERDVLMHEIGHHVDRKNLDCKTDKKAEGFADWFATHYGFHERM